jgi:hypothetical protein
MATEVVLTAGERSLIAALLKHGYERLKNRICSDFEFAEAMPDLEERRSLMQRAEAWNGSPEDFDPEAQFIGGPDWWLMRIMAGRLEGDIPDADPFGCLQ